MKDIKKRDIVELVGIIVKVNGKRMVIPRKRFKLRGWEYYDEDSYYIDNGVAIKIYDNKGNVIYKMEYD